MASPPRLGCRPFTTTCSPGTWRTETQGNPCPSPSSRTWSNLQSCVLRPWAPSDKSNLVRYANNKAVWRNLLDSCPHPSSKAEAEFWIAHAQANPGLHFAIQFGGEAVGGIGVV